MKTQRRAFSLIELMMAIFIIACVLLLMIGLFTMLFNTSKKGVDLTAGTAVAQLVMEEWLYSTCFSSGALSMPATGGVGTNGTKPINGVIFTYYIRMSAQGGPAGGENPKLRQVDTTVYWWLSGQGTAEKGFQKGYGMTKTKLTKLVWLVDEY